MNNNFTEDNFHSICDHLALQDVELSNIIQWYGYPPFWSREPGFATLIYIILEQQVSLASAKAAFIKLQNYLVVITPEGLIALTSEELKACYFSRQKIIYARNLAENIISKQLILEQLPSQSDSIISKELKKIKGIGDWTVDVYLMMALHRADCFPFGDIALVNSLKDIKGLPKDTAREELTTISNAWKPYRTVAAFLLWHSYLSKRIKAGKTETPEEPGK